MKIEKDVDITNLNTLGVKTKASFFMKIENDEDLGQLFNSKEFKENKKVFLGGGSNILFTKDFDGIVILNKLKGISILDSKSSLGGDIFVRSMSGVVWHDLVNFTTSRDLWGIENLALIPGTVGGAPVQNIGAYGVEMKDSLCTVEAYDIEDGSKKVFKTEECGFGYRDSIFKSKFKGKYFIYAITIKLTKKPRPNISYKILSDYIKEHNIKISNSKDVALAVENIRRSKLPDPAILGNAGSFFKNVFVDEEQLQELMVLHSGIKYFTEGNAIKIPAAWLIEQCGWKGKKMGRVGVHEKHALIIVNYGGATGKEVEALANQITESVFLKFNLKLIPEVNFI